ncbi:MAG: homoserine dehydrogenase [Anaerolineae bacterium]|nr:homoserine dehydrogenase [Anaerolineae bacterium]
MKLVLMGFGNVGQGFVQILHDKAAALQQEQGFRAVIVGVATRSGGTLWHPDGLEPAALLAAARSGGWQHYPEQPGLRRDLSPLALIQHSGAEALLEASPTRLDDAQPALDYCLAAFAAGMHVILANKGPVALAYPRLLAAARAAGRDLRFEATVMAGTPCLTLAREALAGCTLYEARGILNGTTNYMLTQMSAGATYEAALAEAQRLGYAETDPTADVDGYDAAGKLLILAAALYGVSLRLSDLSVAGIRGLTPADLAAARQAGECYKLIARITPQGGSVGPQRLPLTHPLAAVHGSTNAITFTTDLMGEITLVGAGAGGTQTGFALLSDLLALQRRHGRQG